MPRPTHNKRPATAATLRRRRIEQLEATLDYCLHRSGAEVAAFRSTWREALSSWLDEADPASRRDLFSSLGDALRRACPEPAASISEPLLIAAFAHSLLQQAQQAVATEAARAGHANSYQALSTWIEQKTDSAVLDSLGQALGRSPADLHTALGRLRHRLLQRVDAALADWCNSTSTQQTLRRRLRDALAPSETSA